MKHTIEKKAWRYLWTAPTAERCNVANWDTFTIIDTSFVNEILTLYKRLMRGKKTLRSGPNYVYNKVENQKL